MSEPLEGTTYRGNFLVADVAMPAPFPRDEAGVICGPNGLLLLAPLPGGRWISFQDLEEDIEKVSAEEVVARVVARLGGKYRPTDVGWFAPFRMHRRIVSRLADSHRFLIGDAAHLSSPFGGEGLNAGLHDGYDLAWKLALVLRGNASQTLLDAYRPSAGLRIITCWMSQTKYTTQSSTLLTPHGSTARFRLRSWTRSRPQWCATRAP